MLLPARDLSGKRGSSAICSIITKHLQTSWTREEVDKRLKGIMSDIHDACVQYGQEENGYCNYVKGANIAGFVKVADAMLAQGVI